MSIKADRVKRSLSHLLLLVICGNPPLCVAVAAAGETGLPTQPGTVAEMGTGMGSEADVSPRRTAAVWLEHEHRFWYHGRTTLYSCDALGARVAYLLRAIGARPDAHVTVSCLGSIGPGQMPSVRIKAALPAEATPEVLAQLQAQMPRRELIRRVQGKRGPFVDEAMAQFPASWRPVVIDAREDRVLEAGDCELVEQFAKQLLGPLGVKVRPDNRLRCVPNSRMASFKLSIETLQPYAPSAPAALQSTAQE